MRQYRSIFLSERKDPYCKILKETEAAFIITFSLFFRSCTSHNMQLFSNTAPPLKLSSSTHILVSYDLRPSNFKPSKPFKIIKVGTLSFLMSRWGKKQHTLVFFHSGQPLKVSVTWNDPLVFGLCHPLSLPNKTMTKKAKNCQVQNEW